MFLRANGIRHRRGVIAGAVVALIFLHALHVAGFRIT